MRMGLATFMPLQYGLAGGEDSSMVALMERFEMAMNGAGQLSMRGLLDELTNLPPKLRRSRLGRCLLAWALGDQRQHLRALSLLDELMGEWEAEVDGPRSTEATRWLISGRTYQGMLYMEEGRYGHSARCFREAQQRMHSQMPEVVATRVIAIGPEEAGRLTSLDPTGFANLLVEALRYCDTIGDLSGAARAANNIGHLYTGLGEPASARYWFERSVELLQRNSNDLQLAYALDSLGLCYQQLGLADEAQAALDEALVRATRTDNASVKGSVLTCLADLHRDRGRFDVALELYAKAQSLAVGMRYAAGQVRAHLGRSTLLRRTGQAALALEEADEALALLKAQADPLLTDRARLHQQVAAILLERSEAGQQLESVVGRLAGRPARREETLGQWYLALAASQAGDQERTAEHLRGALALAAEYRHLHMLALELPVTVELPAVALAQSICPEALAGLVQRADREGLALLLERVPASAPVLAAAGRLSEAQALSVSLLGLFRVVRGGRELSLTAVHSQKAIALLKFLMVHRGRSVSREQILDAIWPEADSAAADRSLDVTLSTLRKRLDADGPSVILRRGRGYMLNPELVLDVDVDRFLHHLRQGAWWQARGQAGPAEAEWRAAEACYGGDFLAEDPYEDWAVSDRERLREQYLDLLLHLAELNLQQGRYGEAVERASRVLAADPIRESAYRLQMRAHAAMGDRAVALRDYQRCVAVLRQELGEEPMPETKELAREIRSR